MYAVVVDPVSVGVAGRTGDLLLALLKLRWGNRIADVGSLGLLRATISNDTVNELTLNVLAAPLAHVNHTSLT